MWNMDTLVDQKLSTRQVAAGPKVTAGEASSADMAWPSAREPVVFGPCWPIPHEPGQAEEPIRSAAGTDQVSAPASWPLAAAALDPVGFHGPIQDSGCQPVASRR